MSKLSPPHSDEFSGPGTDSSNIEPVFDALVTQYYPHLCTFALRLLGSRDAAEDAVQDVLYKVWSRRSIETIQDPVPYLYQAVRNQCLMALRRERRWNTTAIDADDTAHVTSDDYALLDLQQAIARAIDALPERTRLVFTMHRQQDLTYGDIARILGISIKTVETQMARALKILRHRLDTFFTIGATLSTMEWWLHTLR